MGGGRLPQLHKWLGRATNSNGSVQKSSSNVEFGRGELKHARIAEFDATGIASGQFLQTEVQTEALESPFAW